VVTALSCSLVGQEQAVAVRPGTRLAGLVGESERVEGYWCNYGVNESFRSRLEAGGLVVSAVGDHGEIRAVELPGHPFYVATLFLPQLRSSPDRPHPVFTGLRDAASR
jgi:CTP synthase (UTP-ammonia lyase)